MAVVEASEGKPIRVATTSNRIQVLIEDRDDVEVEGRAEIVETDTALTIADVASALTVRVPVGSDLVIGSESGRVRVTGDAGDVAVVTTSGRVEVERAASADVRTTSGRVEIGDCEGQCRVRSNSGRVQVDRCGGADVATTSARISLRHVDGPVQAHCVSGRIEIQLDNPHDVEAETVTGRVQVKLPEGVRAFRTAEAGAVTAVPEECECTVQARSVTGRIDVSSR